MRTITIGDVTISSIVERDGPWRTPEAMFPAYDAEAGRRHLAALDPVVFDPASGRMVITYQTFVVRTPRHTILVDTCTGEDKGYPAPMDFPKQPWLDGFRAQGLRLEDIDYVFCTHLHIDHCGWNTRLVDGRWVPTFPRARYLFGRREFEHWSRPEAGDEAQRAVFADSVRPILDAGLAELVDADHQLCEEVRLVPTHGHTPGHVSVRIASEGEEAFITGDIAHHPCQLARPQWSTTADSDPDAAAATRRHVFGGLAGRPVLVIGTHFAGPTAGRVVRDGEGFRLLVCW